MATPTTTNPVSNMLTFGWDNNPPFVNYTTYQTNGPNNTLLTGPQAPIEDNTEFNNVGDSERALRKFISKYGSAPTSNIDQAGDVISYRLATEQFPDVYSWYQINPAATPFMLSLAKDQLQSGNYRIKPTQLTGYAGLTPIDFSGVNPMLGQNSGSSLGIVLRDIIVEWRDTPYEYSWNQWNTYNNPGNDSEGNPITPQTDEAWAVASVLNPWHIVDRFNGAQLSPNGRYIRLEGLRDRGPNQPGCTWACEKLISNEMVLGLNVDPHTPAYLNSVQGMYSGKYMFRRHIRIQLAVESDECLCALRGGEGEDTWKTKDHINPPVPFTVLFGRNSPPLNYVRWERYKYSYPLGIAYNQSQQNMVRTWFPEKESGGGSNTLWSDYIDDTTLNGPDAQYNRLTVNCEKYRANHQRVMWEGWYKINMMTPVYNLGDIVTFQAPNSLSQVTSAIKCIIMDANTQTTMIEVGPPDFLTIWNGPLSFAGSGGAKGDSFPGLTTGIVKNTIIPLNTNGDTYPPDKPGRASNSPDIQKPVSSTPEAGYGDLGDEGERGVQGVKGGSVQESGSDRLSRVTADNKSRLSGLKTQREEPLNRAQQAFNRRMDSTGKLGPLSAQSINQARRSESDFKASGAATRTPRPDAGIYTGSDMYKRDAIRQANIAGNPEYPESMDMDSRISEFRTTTQTGRNRRADQEAGILHRNLEDVKPSWSAPSNRVPGIYSSEPMSSLGSRERGPKGSINGVVPGLANKAPGIYSTSVREQAGRTLPGGAFW